MTTTATETLKSEAKGRVDTIRDEVLSVSRTIWENPELGLQERKASALLCDTLERHGIPVTRGIAGMETAFQADFGTSGPLICIMAEYDALPGVGHGCGHNIIAASALGASLALASLGNKLPGRIRLLGTPAEESAVENAGGKVPILREGHLREADAAIMMHPGSRTMASVRPSLAARSMKVEFFGKAAHAAGSPHLGINALDAMLLTFNAIGLLRQQVQSDARIHGVITHGGDAPNIIPAHTSARIRVRSRQAAYLGDLYQRVLACAEGAAKATGTRLEWKEDVHPYHNTVPNFAVAETINTNLKSLGLTIDEQDPDGGGSTDFGNISHALPASCAYLSIAPRGTPGHSDEMREAAGSPTGVEAVMNGSKVLAMTAVDLLTDMELLRRAKEEWSKTDHIAEPW